MNNRAITNDKLYDRLDDIRKELKGDIVNAVSTVSQNQGRLEKKFDDLEAGRLTRLEGTVTDLRVRLQQYEGSSSKNEAVLSTKLLIIGTIGVILLTGLSEALFYKVFIK